MSNTETEISRTLHSNPGSELRSHHTWSRENNYQAAEYQPHEYPKWVNGRLVNSAEEETAVRGK